MKPPELDETHDAALRSWVESSDDPATDFPIQNLPLGLFRPRGSTDPDDIEAGVAIGDQILSLRSCARARLLLLQEAPGEEELSGLFEVGSDLLPLLAAGRKMSARLRAAVSGILSQFNDDARRRADELLVAQRDVEMLLPHTIFNYTDFYASVHHATNVGSMFRPDNPLLPNYKYVPIGYHGRASSIVPSGALIVRPSGQTRDDANAPPVFGPTRRLDYEMEVGAFIARGNAMGQPIPVADAADHLFGLCLVNDWSARDIQSWEYQPLGPFLSKSFATTISPWIVTAEALAPFRVPAARRPAGDPAPLPYLSDPDEAARGAFAITVEVSLRSARMRDEDQPAMLVSRGGFRDMYWTFGQMIAHHTSNGCNFAPGDLIASGTISGPDEESRGCLLERTWRGTRPLELPTGERRSFLEDGDEVIMRGYAERDGFRRIGFGDCRGVVRSA